MPQFMVQASPLCLAGETPAPQYKYTGPLVPPCLRAASPEFTPKKARDDSLTVVPIKS